VCIKAARAEAKAAKDMMAKFKDEYSQRFSKLKEALMKHNNNPHVNVSEGKDIVDGGNVVANRYAYCSSSFMSSRCVECSSAHHMHQSKSRTSLCLPTKART
jgi:hypothetical protein